jgi:hypothetical protein
MRYTRAFGATFLLTTLFGWQQNLNENSNTDLGLKFELNSNRTWEFDSIQRLQRWLGCNEVFKLWGWGGTKPMKAQQPNTLIMGMMTSAMLVSPVSILFWWFSLTPSEFRHMTNCIGNVISLHFYAYIECQKWSPDAILASVLVWM